MKIQRIIQIVAGYSNADAISNEARTMRDIFRKWEYETHIVCEKRRILPQLAHDAMPFEDYAAMASSNDIVLLHLSIGSISNDLFPSLPGHRIILYHNITPAHYMHAINHEIEQELEWGRKQVSEMKNTAEIVLADSQFNANELMQVGYSDVKVFPLVLNWDSLNNEVDSAALNEWSDGSTNILFVGRCAPNKCLEDLLFAFHYFQQYVQPHSRLIYAGSFAGTEKYYSALRLIRKRLKLHNCEMTGSIPQATLNTAYQVADLFLCMSEHEGFCIPLLEAMERNVPVLAFDAGAVAETMDGSGILFKEKRFDLIAEMMGRITQDSCFKNTIISQQHERITRYKTRDPEAELRAYFGALL